MIVRLMCLCLLGMAFVAVQALADGFSADIGAGVLVVNKSDNLWGRGKANIDSINSKPKGETWVSPIPVVYLRYRQESLKNTYYLGATHEDYGRLGLGVKHDLDKGGAIDAALFYSFMGKEWENPYMLNRNSTNVKNFGLRTTWDNIAGTPISVNYRVSVKFVDHDASGALNQDLKRDGTTHRLGANYKVKLSDSFVLTPAVAYERGNAEGAANRYNTAEAALMLIWKRNNLTWSNRASGFYSVFDKTNPYYGQARREPGFAFSSVAVWKNPFGFDNYSLTAGYIHEHTFSNIAFFEKRGDIGFVMAGYSFR